MLETNSNKKENHHEELIFCPNSLVYAIEDESQMSVCDNFGCVGAKRGQNEIQSSRSKNC